MCRQKSCSFPFPVTVTLFRTKQFPISAHWVDRNIPCLSYQILMSKTGIPFLHVFVRIQPKTRPQNPQHLSCTDEIAHPSVASEQEHRSMWYFTLLYLRAHSLRPQCKATVNWIWVSCFTSLLLPCVCMSDYVLPGLSVRCCLAHYVWIQWSLQPSPYCWAFILMPSGALPQKKD